MVALTPAEGILELMTRLGHTENALAYIKPGDDAGRISVYTGEIIAALDPNQPEERALLFRLVRQALDRISGDDEAHWLLARLLERCPLLVGDDVPDLIKRSGEIFNAARNYWATPRALSELGRLTTAAGCFRPDPGIIFQLALKAILRFCKSSRSLETERLFRYWSAYDARAAAAGLLEIPLSVSPTAAKVICTVARALAAVGERSALMQAQGHLLRDFLGGEDPIQLAGILTEFALLELDFPDMDGTRHSLELATAQIDKATADDDQLRYGATARVLLLPIWRCVDAERGPVLLDEAWSAVGRFGCSNEALRVIVRMQAPQGVDALTRRVEAINETTVQARLYTMAGLELVSADPTGAREMLHRALFVSATV